MLVLTSLIFRSRRSSRSALAEAPKKKQSWFRFLFLLFFSCCFFAFLLLLAIGGIIAYGTYEYLASTLPEPSRGAMLAMPESTRIMDRHGELLYEVHGDVKRSFVPLKRIPVVLQKATIAIEDKDFYTHPGYDIRAIVRAMYKNYQNQGISQGASTITQQLARTMFLTQEKSYVRKAKELILAIEIEKRYSKDEILEMYLNNIPYGSIAYGVSAAADIYLDKSVEELTALESAYLAALPKAPSDYSPFGSNRAALDQRAIDVISAMYEQAYLTEGDLDWLLARSKPDFVSPPHIIKAPHFVFYALEELEKRYGQEEVRSGGLNIYTTIDMAWQRRAEEIVEKWGRINESKYGAGNAALTAVDPTSGEILAMVGSRDYFEGRSGSFNAATSPRQPGSSFKPYVYAAAFQNGLTPDSIIVDNRTDFAAFNHGVSYVPQNYSGRYYGSMPVRKALAGSLNIPAVKTIVSVGVNKTIDLAERLGITTLSERQRFGPALALGGGELKLLEHTAAMGAFGQGGRKMPTAAILRIENRAGTLIYAREKEKPAQAVEEKAAYFISDILSDNKAREYIFGSRNKLAIPGYRVAVKTGTTQDYHDAWTVGYTPSIAVGVWTGNNDNHPMKQGADGSYVAAPIWREFMDFALPKVPKKDFVKPQILTEKKEPKPVSENKAKSEESKKIKPEPSDKSGNELRLVPAANAMGETLLIPQVKETKKTSPKKIPKTEKAPSPKSYELPAERRTVPAPFGGQGSGAAILAPCQNIGKTGTEECFEVSL